MRSLCNLCSKQCKHAALDKGGCFSKSWTKVVLCWTKKFLCVEAAAAGAHPKGARDKWVVKWDSDGHNVRPGPGKLNNSNNYNIRNNIAIICP